MIKLSPPQALMGPSPLAMEPVVAARINIADLAPDAEATVTQALARHINPKAQPVQADNVDDRIALQLVQAALNLLNARRGGIEIAGCRRQTDGNHLVWLSSFAPQHSYDAMRIVVEIANQALAGETSLAAMQQRIADFHERSRSWHPDGSDVLIIAAAKADAIPWMPAWKIGNHWQIGWGKNSQVFSSAASNLDGFLTSRICNQKQHTKFILQTLGLPTPEAVTITSEEQLDGALATIGFPCVIKPPNLGHGEGVTAAINSREHAVEALQLAQSLSPLPILVERHVEGADHRLLVIGGKLLIANRKDIPVVTGDGKRTIAQLLEELNVGRSRPGHLVVGRLVTILNDDQLAGHLARSGLTADSVPQAGEVVTLRSTSNTSGGGSYAVVTDLVHPEVRQAVEALAVTVGAHTVGVDYLTTDISRTWHEVPGHIIELNTTPSLISLTVDGSDPLEAGRSVRLPGIGRIPLDLIVVDEPQLAEAEAFAAARCTTSGHGWAGCTKAVMGGAQLSVRQLHGWSGAATLLAFRTLERAWIVASDAQIQQNGFPVDRADRLWFCNVDLPRQWDAVAQRVSATPIWRGSLADLAGAV